MPPIDSQTKTGLKIKNEINLLLNEFHPKYVGQYHLSIPSGVIQKVDEYRKHYVPYLHESYYKSNICYLLQMIDYQIWLYKLFKPSLSLENAYLFQLLISIGTVAEAICMGILVNPLLSLEQDKMATYLIERMSKNSFHLNLKLMETLQLLEKPLLDNYQNIRTDIRNMVHIHNWGSSLYNTLTFTVFEEKLQVFKNLLSDVKQNIQLHHNKDSIIKSIFGDEIDLQKEYKGTIRSFSEQGSYGFIKVAGFNSEIFFHRSSIKEKMDSPQIPIYNASKKNLGIKNQRVVFILEIGKKGLEARNILFIS